MARAEGRCEVCRERTGVHLPFCADWKAGRFPIVTPGWRIDLEGADRVLTLAHGDRYRYLSEVKSWAPLPKRPTWSRPRAIFVRPSERDRSKRYLKEAERELEVYLAQTAKGPEGGE
jgi:hypothetical protein